MVTNIVSNITWHQHWHKCFTLSLQICDSDALVMFYSWFLTARWAAHPMRTARDFMPCLWRCSWHCWELRKDFFLRNFGIVISLFFYLLFFLYFFVCCHLHIFVVKIDGTVADACSARSTRGPLVLVNLPVAQLLSPHLLMLVTKTTYQQPT